MSRTAIDYALLESLASDGKTVAEISDRLGISPATYYYRMKSDPRFKAAASAGRDDGPEDSSGSAIPADAQTQKKGDGECRARILAALGDGCHLRSQIARRTGEAAWRVLDLLADLVADGEVECVESPQFSAYFLRGQVPVGRLVLDGGGGIAVQHEPSCLGTPDDVPDSLEADAARPASAAPAGTLHERPNGIAGLGSEGAAESPADCLPAPAGEPGICFSCGKYYVYSLYDGSPYYCSADCRANSRDADARAKKNLLNDLQIGSFEIIPLEAHGEVTVSVSANLFEVSDSDFEFLSGLRSLIRRFRDAHRGTEGVFTPEKIKTEKILN